MGRLFGFGGKAHRFESRGFCAMMQVFGHEWAVHSLESSAHRAQLRNAYLFCGVHGIGKRTLARQFAQRLLCQQPNAPCGECRTCKLVALRHHPDVLWVEPVVSGQLIKTAKIGIEAIRELNYQLNIRPVEAERRIAILSQFETANEAAANALLKTLEEPPGNALFLLTASDEQALLPTILSRCERLSLRPLPIYSVQNALERHWQVPTERAQLLAHLSAGRLGWAVQMLHTPEALQVRQKALDDLSQQLSNSLALRFVYAEQLSKDRELLTVTLDHWRIWWRDVLLRVSGQGERVVNIDRLGEFSSLQQRVTAQQAAQAVEEIETALARLERNANARLVLENLLLEWPRLLVAG
jgi:DNA polymerase-3 subunit delta'